MGVHNHGDVLPTCGRAPARRYASQCGPAMAPTRTHPPRTAITPPAGPRPAACPYPHEHDREDLTESYSRVEGKQRPAVPLTCCTPCSPTPPAPKTPSTLWWARLGSKC